MYCPCEHAEMGMQSVMEPDSADDHLGNAHIPAT